jgi:hypothetical protein
LLRYKKATLGAIFEVSRCRSAAISRLTEDLSLYQCFNALFASPASLTGGLAEF